MTKNTKEIIIDGINLTDIKNRQDVILQEMSSLRKSIQKGAVKFISDKTDELKTLVVKFKDSETVEEAKEQAPMLYDVLRDIQFVAEVAAISYYIPFRDNDYSYCGDRHNSIVNILDENEEGIFEFEYGDKENPLTMLAMLAEDMESTVREWNTSVC